MATERVRIAIIGAGFAGIGMAVKLLDAGREDFVILERDADVGGTWLANTYPGVKCDIPAHLYSFSFEPRADWTTAYPAQAEIQDYFHDVVDKYGLHRFLRLNTAVVEAAYDEGEARWRLRTADGDEYVADVVIGGLGPLRDPAYPSIEGRDDFAGPTMHTARWDDDVELAGRRAGVIGTGSSGIQVVPPVAKVAGHLTVFQRSAPWVIPLVDRTYSRLEKAILRYVPGARWLFRALTFLFKEIRFLGFLEGSPFMRLMERYSMRHMRRHIDDPETQRQLEPDYRMGCKRILLSNSYYPTLARDHVELVTDPIERILADGIVTASGRHVPLDVLIYATGFEVSNMLGDLTVTGRGGRDLETVWHDRPAAYLGTTVPGFPNLFLMLGPNTGLGHNSMVFVMEAQYRYVLGALDVLDRPGVAAVDVRHDALEVFTAEMRERTKKTVWASGCRSWYLSEDGYNFTLWPGFTVEYWWRTRRFDPERYHVLREADLPTPVAP